MNGCMALVPYHADMVGKKHLEHASKELAAPGRPPYPSFALQNNVQVGY